MRPSSDCPTANIRPVNDVMEIAKLISVALWRFVCHVNTGSTDYGSSMWIMGYLGKPDSGCQTDGRFHFWICGRFWHTSIYSVTRVPKIPDWKPTLLYSLLYWLSGTGCTRCTGVWRKLIVYDTISSPFSAMYFNMYKACVCVRSPLLLMSNRHWDCCN